MLWLRCTDGVFTPARGHWWFDRGGTSDSLLSFWLWRGARRAEQHPYWVSHTYEVMALIEGTLRDVRDTKAIGHEFALSGQEYSSLNCVQEFICQWGDRDRTIGRCQTARVAQFAGCSNQRKFL